MKLQENKFSKPLQTGFLTQVLSREICPQELSNIAIPRRKLSVELTRLTGTLVRLCINLRGTVRCIIQTSKKIASSFWEQNLMEYTDLLHMKICFKKSVFLPENTCSIAGIFCIY